ncbi:LptA/OstA family protein [Thermodesulforhabdus norvegica]|uniref:Lipopolysaccharide export system protein LptA n=1 Tax=Thermodesulforhabdus norvegica TaxID=39841 RepID=A0A1I4VJF7_9BACT|nr:LptA/OstA family protein [Thermodesulforhabdus norvegica]SFN01186.1 lipopolysaccharide export system protein LptA [Thermodesulforhabdus norvegica]
MATIRAGRKFSLILAVLMIEIFVQKGTAEKVVQSASPLRIVSDRMVLDEKSRTITFEGHVTVEREDIVITCRRLTVFGSKEADFSSSFRTGGPVKEEAVMKKIDRIEAEGDVRVVQGNRVATSEKAIYYVDRKRIVLTGSPVVAQGQDRLTGQLITLDLATGKSIVEGGREKPVEVILHPSSEPIKQETGQ